MIYLTLGRRVMGKTTLAFYLARRCPSRVIFDPRCQFDGDDHERATDNESLALGFEQLQPDAPDRISELVVAPTGSLNNAFKATMRNVLNWTRTTQAPLAVLIDEIAFLDLTDSDDFMYLIRASPRDRLHLILTGHRPKDVPVDVRSLADEWLIFRTVQQHDLDVIAERCGTEIADACTKLVPYSFMQWDDARGIASRHAPLATYPRVSKTQNIPGGTPLLLDRPSEKITRHTLPLDTSDPDQ